MEKETAFYAAMVRAWVDTKMERDRWGLIISTVGAAIALVLRLSIGGLTDGHGYLLRLMVVNCLFSAAIFLTILKRNASYIERVIGGRDCSAVDAELERLDSLAFSSLCVALVWVVGLVAF